VSGRARGAGNEQGRPAVWAGGPGSHEPERIPAQVWIVLLTTVLGWTVTTLDLQLSAFLQKQIAPALHASGTFVGNVFFIFSAGLAVGALVLGYFSDLWIGRRRAFMYSILGTILLTGVTGFTSTPAEFALVRFFAGVFSGGEWILGLSILSEVAPRRHRSIMLGATQAAVGVGYGIANTFAATFAAPNAAGWRWAYFASFGFAALTYLVRLKVEESPYWKRAVEHGSNRRISDIRDNARDLFAGRQRRLTLLAVGLFVAIGEPQGTWDFLYPKWYAHIGHQYGGGTGITYAYEIAIIVSTIACGWFMDRVSAKRLWPVVLLSVPFTLLIWQTSKSTSVIVAGVFLFLAGFGRQGMWSLVAGYFPVLFPTRLRGTGMGVTWVGGWLLGYTLSAEWGTQLQAHVGWGTWWVLQAILLALIPLPMIFAGVETHGRDLDFQEAESSATPQRVAPGPRRPGGRAATA
jgi:MFS family permease